MPASQGLFFTLDGTADLRSGPPLLKAATGEIATEEELGGAEMHTGISGLGDYLAEDDRDALRRLESRRAAERG